MECEGHFASVGVTSYGARSNWPQLNSMFIPGHGVVEHMRSDNPHPG